MTYITQAQKDTINSLRAAGVSFTQISVRTGIPQGTAKTIHYDYRNNPAKGVPSVKAPDGKFRAQKPRTPGRRPKNGIRAMTEADRAKAYRARKKALAGIRDAASRNVKVQKNQLKANHAKNYEPKHPNHRYSGA